MNERSLRARRQFLKTLGGGAVCASSLATMSGTLAGFNAMAAETDDYRALVCVFLLGGMDNWDTVIPYDSESYNGWAGVRAPLLSSYSGSRSRANLLPLQPIDGATDTRQYALPPELTGIHGLFQQGRAAIVGNVGPLIQPTDRAAFESESVLLPARLFSHNDQQATWMSSSPEGASYGWGGGFTDAMLAAGANSEPAFSAITSGGNELFLTGRLAIPYQVGLGGAQQPGIFEDLEPDTREYEIFRRLFAAGNYQSDKLLQRDMATAMANAWDANSKYNLALQSSVLSASGFPMTPLGEQLAAVANTIAIRDSLGARRQVFIVAMGGFDTHDQQATDLPALQTQLDTAVTRFYEQMTELELAANVTLFTASDFGRTLAVNGDGTDHGWGGHHFVVGDAVSGGRFYGELPSAVLGHNQDSGSGRLIPTTSVEQFAAPLGQWFGLNDGELQVALPALANFSASPRFMLL